MYVIKRNKQREGIDFNKILNRVTVLADGLEVDPVIIAQSVVSGLYPGVTTVQLDELAAETAAALSTTHPDYSKLAARIGMSNLHKQTSSSFSGAIQQLHDFVDKRTNKSANILADDVYDIIMANKDILDAAIVAERDLQAYDWFAFRTLMRSYLLKVDGKVIERPCYMLMRVSVGIHKEDIDSAIETYNMMSQRLFTMATPTLFNSGTKRPQLSSCFLLGMQDSIEDIYDTLKQTALISKNSGGIGLAAHDIRATDSYIVGTGGSSNGIIPMLRVFNQSARYVDQVKCHLKIVFICISIRIHKHT
jgi:ribonucleotide reductase alpha subunit